MNPSLKLERGHGIRVVGQGSWKEREVGKFNMKLERLKLERLNGVSHITFDYELRQ